MKRRATYTVEVPIRFRFSAEADIGEYERYAMAEKELEQRLINGRFEVLTKQLDIVDKAIIYTREEKQESQRQWEEIIKDLVIPEPKKTNIFVTIFKGRKK